MPTVELDACRVLVSRHVILERSQESYDVLVTFTERHGDGVAGGIVAFDFRMERGERVAERKSRFVRFGFDCECSH